MIHNPEMIGPHTELLGLIAPGDWVDFFRYVGEAYAGVVVPEADGRDLKQMMIPKLMAAKDRFDVHFERGYQPPDVGEWLDSETALAGPLKPYFLRANTGPRHVLGGVMSRPLVLAGQCGGRFAISSIESSSVYGKSPLAGWLAFGEVDHCFVVQEGLLKVKLKGEAAGAWSEVREGQTVLVPAGQAFTLEFGSRYVRFYSFTNGRGVEELVQLAGKSCPTVILPDEVDAWEASKIQDVCKEIGATVEDL